VLPSSSEVPPRTLAFSTASFFFAGSIFANDFTVFSEEVAGPSGQDLTLLGGRFSGDETYYAKTCHSSLLHNTQTSQERLFN
jgi:hypothetical protein